MKSEVRIVASLALLYAVRMLGLFMALPVLFLYGESYTSATAITLGFALGAYGLAQALFQIPMGLLSDFFGRKPIIIVGLVLFAVGSLIAASSDNVYGLIMGRVLQGSGAIASTIMALVADLTSDENRSKAMAAIGASIGVSFMASLILGPTLASHWGLSGIFIAAFALSLVGMCVLAIGVPSSRSGCAPRREVAAVPSLIFESIKQVELARLHFGIFTLHAVLTSIFVAVPGLLVMAGIDQADHSLVYLPMLLLAFLVAVPVMMAFERRGRGKLIFTFAILLLSLCLFALAFLPSLTLFVALLFLFFVAFNLLEAMLPSLVSKLAPAGTRGTVMGVYSSSQFFGAFFGGAIGGALVYYWGVSTLFFLCALMCSLWFFAALKMTWPHALSNLSFAVEPGVTGLDLLSQQGVEEAVYIEDEKLMYLKVDLSCLDLAELKACIAPFRLRSGDS